MPDDTPVPLLSRAIDGADRSAEAHLIVMMAGAAVFLALYAAYGFLHLGMSAADFRSFAEAGALGLGGIVGGALGGGLMTGLQRRAEGP